MPHHKRKRPKHRRAGSLVSKASKLNAYKTADRMKGRREWQRDWADELDSRQSNPYPI